jgi:hypothetical protein
MDLCFHTLIHGKIISFLEKLVLSSFVGYLQLIDRIIKKKLLNWG